MEYVRNVDQKLENIINYGKIYKRI